MTDLTFVFGGGGPWGCSAAKFSETFLHFEGTLEQNIEVLNDISLQRTSSTIISVQMKFDFHFAFYFNKV